MQLKPIELTYITATKNKLAYFRQGLERLVANKKPGEEIIVADGNSTDGTKEYLEEMKLAGKIDDYISEPDYSESHALNKMFLRARGEIIKIINDDDAFYFPVINACKEFMLSHTDIDVLGMEGGSFKHKTPNKQEIMQVVGYTDNFKKWKENHTPFEFAVLGLMFRKSALPIIGFWNLSFKNADAEFTFRVTSSKAKLAWCLSPAFVFIRTIDGVTWKNLKRMKEEALRLRKFYLDEKAQSPVIPALKKILRKIISILTLQKTIVPNEFATPWADMYKEAESWLIEKNKGKKVEFLS